MENQINWTRVNNDVNGNPRYVCHFSYLLTNEERKSPMWNSVTGKYITPTKYQIAVKRANKIGGRKFHNKRYGGGIVFQSYSLKETENAIKRILDSL